MAKWNKTTPCGDYSDPLQNHKFDGELHFKDENLKTIIVRTKRHELLHHCRTLNTHGKHVGSKPYKNLISPLKRYSKARSLYNKLLNSKKKEVSNTDKQ